MGTNLTRVGGALATGGAELARLAGATLLCDGPAPVRGATVDSRLIAERRGALFVAEVEEAMLLVEVGLVKEEEEAAEDVVVLDLLVVGDPAVAEALEDEADAMHLAVGAGGAAKGPAEPVRTDEVGHRLDVFLGVGAERGQLAVAHAAVGVELQGGADEHEGHHAVEVEVAAKAGGGVVEEAGGAGLADALDHPFDQTGGLVLFGEAEAEAGDGFGDVEGLPMVVVVAAVEQLLVEALLGLLDEAFPDGVAFLGGAEAEEAEGGVGQAVLGGRLGEHLGRDGAGREVEEVVTGQGTFAGGTVVFAQGEGDVARFVGPGVFSGNGERGAVRLDGVEVVAQDRAGHIETLLGETVHAVSVEARW